MIQRAVEILRDGGLVAFPTETVYGLGADARNPDAVAKIFAAKGRPATNPLIVHAHNLAAARECAASWPPIADRLAEQFWPGPLTLVVSKHPRIVDAVAAGGRTVGLRVPAHPLALELLQAFDGPIAAPSANRSNRISPTTADHVRQELGAHVELILNGGPCRLGIESTVLLLTEALPTILRPGSITPSQIEQIIGPVLVREEPFDAKKVAQAPGQQAVHYAPNKPAMWITATTAIPEMPGRSACIAFTRNQSIEDKDWFEMPSDAQAYARQFYAALRSADESNVDRILIVLPPPLPEWEAIRDRILRAAKPLLKSQSSRSVDPADELSDARGRSAQ